MTINRGNLMVISAGFSAGAVLLCSPSLAAAHLVSTGMGPVYDGIGHLLLTPEDLLPVIALALYAGMRGAGAARRAMFLLPLSWFVGGVAGAALGLTIEFPVAALSLLFLGGLLAADLYLPVVAVTGLSVVFGLGHGFLNGVALREGTGALGLVGIMAMLFILNSIISAMVVAIGKPWTRIAVRVGGSWMAAMGLLMFGWAMR